MEAKPFYRLLGEKDFPWLSVLVYQIYSELNPQSADITVRYNHPGERVVPEEIRFGGVWFARHDNWKWYVEPCVHVIELFPEKDSLPKSTMGMRLRFVVLIERYISPGFLDQITIIRPSKGDQFRVSWYWPELPPPVSPCIAE